MGNKEGGLTINKYIFRNQHGRNNHGLSGIFHE
jgi:hypothetical protein